MTPLVSSIAPDVVMRWVGDGSVRRQARKTPSRSRRAAAHEKVHAKLEHMRAALQAGRDKLAHTND